MLKLINAAIFLSFLICYLQWPNNSMFVFEIEWDVLFGGHDKKDSFMHPAIALPFIGQVLLLITLFQRTPNRKLTITAIILMALLVLLLLLIGILGLNFKMIASVSPFIGISVYYFVKGKRFKTN